MEWRSGVLGSLPLAFALAVVAAGCNRSPVGVGTGGVNGHHAILLSTANTMAGSWKQFAPAGFSVPRGIAMDMSLTAHDTTLAGTGTYSMSGGSTGTTNVTGYVVWQDSMLVPSGHIEPAHPVVVLDIALDDGLSAHIDQGRFFEADTLSGVVVFSDHASDAYDATFARVAR